MQMNKPFGCFIVFIFIFFDVCTSKSIGEVCALVDHENGECALLKHCPSALELVKRSMHPKICGFNGNEPIVCCETSKSAKPSTSPLFGPSSSAVVPMSRSKQKCNEYHPEETTVTYQIVGGEKSFEKEFPHMAALGFGDQNNIQWQCGGSLISEDYVLTAAHCLQSPSLGEIRWVRLGDLNIKNTNEGPGRQTFKIETRIRHPQFKPPLRYNDIALVKLDRKAKFDEYVKPICLQTSYETPIASRPIVTGWGNIYFGGENSDIMLKASLNFIDNDKCNKIYSDTIKRNLPKGIVDEIQVCAGDAEGGRGACQGDSGGPLQIFNGRLYLVGITSFGKACGLSNNADVFTRVSSYVPWIESVVWGNKN